LERETTPRLLKLFPLVNAKKSFCQNTERPRKASSVRFVPGKKRNPREEKVLGVKKGGLVAKKVFLIGCNEPLNQIKPNLAKGDRCWLQGLKAKAQSLVFYVQAAGHWGGCCWASSLIFLQRCATTMVRRTSQL